MLFWAPSGIKIAMEAIFEIMTLGFVQQCECKASKVLLNVQVREVSVVSALVAEDRVNSSHYP